MLEVALRCHARGWYIFPCKPKSKQPMTLNGFHDATQDVEQIYTWWKRTPDANVGIATGRSGLTVVDIDHGVPDAAFLAQWMDRNNIPETYAVRTGRRDSFGVQLYYIGGILPSRPWELDGCSGDIRGNTGYVMAEGSIHPDSGEAYTAYLDAPIVPALSTVSRLFTAIKEKAVDDGSPIEHHRNVALTSIAGKLRNAGLSRDALEVALLQVNADRCIPPMDEEEVREIAKHASEWEVPEIEPTVVIGKPKEPQAPLDWRTHYHTYEEMDQAPPPVFLIDGFLQLDAIAAIAAPVGQRKSIIALNVAHALCTGQDLFDYFKVLKKPERVIYLCPEMGLRSFTDRVRGIGLMEYVGKTLFCRTMSMDKLELDELTHEELCGSVIIIDTAVRYLKGDENKSEDMRVFAESIFRLSKEGATILLLHHSAKGTKDAGDLTLENAMRGSGELGAFLYCCWATRLQDPTDEYKSASYITNVKKRDFDSKPFEATCGPDFRLHMVGDPETSTVTLQKRSSYKADKDGLDEAALTLLKATAKLSNAKIAGVLKDAGIKRGQEWVRLRKQELLEANGGLMP